jgi:hypothetical protein
MRPNGTYCPQAVSMLIIDIKLKLSIDLEMQ